MKDVHKTVWPVLMILALLIVSLILLHGSKKGGYQLLDQSALFDKNLLHTYEHVKGGLYAKDYELFASTIRRFAYHQAIGFAQLLMADSSISLTYDEKIEAVLTIAFLYKTFDEQKGFFNCINPEKCQYRAPFLVIVANTVDHLIPHIMTWLNTVYDAKTVQFFCRQAYESIVESNNPQLFDLLRQYRVEFHKEWASELLWQVVTHDKHQQFIPLLMNLGANIYANYLGKTLLMCALERGNKKIAQALITLGADELTTANTSRQPLSNELVTKQPCECQANRIIQAAHVIKNAILKRSHRA
jgi:hypothetical protein